MNDARTRRHFRPDIQGLRAVAVVLVVLDHAFHWPTGGFVGVDVFYVISGFLITSLLLRELEKTGSISLRAFYARRLRRIAPVAAVVLAVTVAAAFVVWYVPRALQVLIDAVSALFFVANWHFIAVGTDYLQADGPVSPVQHFWSLSIEEQFYAVWPLILFGVFLVFKSKRALAAVVLAGLAVSLVASAYLTATESTAAYFNTLGRAWELFAGAIIAVTGVATERVSVPVRHSLSYTGLALIVISAVIVGTTWAVPFPWIAPAVIGAMLVIWSAAPAGRWSILGNPVARWLGDISYSLYLWHFPVLIFAAVLFGDTVWVALAAVPVMLLLSHLSYRVIERPVMKSRFLSRAARMVNNRKFVFRDALVGVAALFLIAFLSVAQLKGPGYLRSATALAPHVMTVDQFEASATEITSDERTTQVRDAINARSWPAPVAWELDRLTDAQQPQTMLSDAPGCRNNVFLDREPNQCHIRDGEAGSALILGDSVALSWSPAIDELAESKGWSLDAVGFGNCSLYDVDVRNGSDAPGFADKCAEKREYMFDLVEKTKPDVVFLSASETAIEYTDLPLSDAEKAWEEGVARTLERLGGVNAIYLLTNPPLSAQPLNCATRVASPSACKTMITDNYIAKSRAEASAADAYPGAVAIDTASWFCADGQCPPFVGDHVVRTDQSHLTEAAGAAVGPLLKEAVDARG